MRVKLWTGEGRGIVYSDESRPDRLPLRPGRRCARGAARRRRQLRHLEPRRSGEPVREVIRRAARGVHARSGRRRGRRCCSRPINATRASAPTGRELLRDFAPVLGRGARRVRRAGDPAGVGARGAPCPDGASNATAKPCWSGRSTRRTTTFAGSRATCTTGRCRSCRGWGDAAVGQRRPDAQDQPTRDALVESATAVRGSIRTLRSAIVGCTHPNLRQTGLGPALSDLTSRPAQEGLHVSLDLDGAATRFPHRGRGAAVPRVPGGAAQRRGARKRDERDGSAPPRRGSGRARGGGRRGGGRGVEGDAADPARTAGLRILRELAVESRDGRLTLAPRAGGRYRRARGGAGVIRVAVADKTIGSCASGSNSCLGRSRTSRRWAPRAGRGGGRRALHAGAAGRLCCSISRCRTSTASR